VRGRGRFGPLTERPFRLLWLGRTGSSIGDSLIPVALAFAVLRIGGGATGLGIVLAAFTIGRASFVVVGGVWADRLPRRGVMITADLVRFLTQVATAALLLGHVAQVWELATLQAVAGAAGGFFAPASTALVPQTVSPPPGGDCLPILQFVPAYDGASKCDARADGGAWQVSRCG
jgi:MFS family permease